MAELSCRGFQVLRGKPALVHLLVCCSSSSSSSSLITVRVTSSINKKTKLLRCFSSKSSSPQLKSSSSTTTSPPPPPEDFSYLWKLGGGSVVGAVVIKYGSILFPAITRPNLLEALTMILSPMLLAVLLLIRQSYAEDAEDRS